MGHIYVWEFIDISTKMHHVFCKMRKLILAKRNLKKESEFYSFGLDAWIHY